jgi:DNA-binding NtrC family response regulator
MVGDVTSTLERSAMRGPHSRCGSERSTGLRIFAATHKDLSARATAWCCCQHLDFRLAALVLTVSPLRERLDAMPLHARIFARARPAPTALVTLGTSPAPAALPPGLRRARESS